MQGALSGICACAARGFRPGAAPSSPIIGIRVGKISAGCLVARIADLLSHDRIAPGRFAEPLRAQLRRAFPRLEVDIHQPEEVAEAIDPL
jgi:hypothetical protein